jgi:arylsulfatase A-like enzyme
MDYLEKYKLQKNTIIIFMSDNGGLSLVPPRGGEAFTHNLPLKAGKGSAYEGGVREPMMVYWPGVTHPNTSNDQYVIIEDFFPSILDMAGIHHYKTVQQTDGQSFVPYLRNNQLRNMERALIWHFPNFWQEGAEKSKKYYHIVPEAQGMGPYSAIRKGDWKLIYFYGLRKTELYNINQDVGELHDLSAREPGKVKELQHLLMERLNEENAQFPKDAASGKTLFPDGTER